MTEDERAIRNLIDAWMSATRKGDIETVLNLMADDAIFMVPGDITITPEHGTPVHRAGYTLTILRKQEDGRWVLARDANLVS